MSGGEPFDTRVLFASVAKHMARIGWSFSVDKGSYMQGRGRQSYSSIMFGWLLHKSLMPNIWSVGTSTLSKSGTESRTYLPEVGNECSLVGEVGSVIGFLEDSFFHKQILAPL